MQQEACAKIGHFSLEGTIVSFFKKTRGVATRRRFLPDRIIRTRSLKVKTPMKKEIAKGRASSMSISSARVVVLGLVLALA